MNICERCKKDMGDLEPYFVNGIGFVCEECFSGPSAGAVPDPFGRDLLCKPNVVMTAGVFDILHRGHLNALWASKALGDVLVVGVVSDAGCLAYKGVMPRQNFQLRIRAIRALGFVDVVEYQPGTDPTELLERYRPDIFTHADGEGDWTALREQVRDMGAEYVNLPYTPGISSTKLRAKKRNETEGGARCAH